MVWPTNVLFIVVAALRVTVSATSISPDSPDTHSFNTLSNASPSGEPPSNTPSLSSLANPGSSNSPERPTAVTSPPTASSSDATATSTNSATPGPASSDIAVMTERRLSFIVAGATKATSIPQWLSTLGPDGKWPDSEVDYTVGCDARPANWPAQDHWNRILTMSAAFHGGLKNADQYVKDPTILSAISRAMDFWFQNDFKILGCMDSGGTAACPCGTPGFWNTNWFSNIILIPNLVSQSCLLIAENLTKTQSANCTNISGRTYGTFGHSVHGLGIATGANLLDIAKIGIDQGLRNLNTSIITDAYNRIHNEVLIENELKADGIRADGSFGQHGGLIYNGNYGKDFTNDVLFLEIVAGGTQFAAGDATKEAFSTLIAGDLWMIFRNVLTGVLHWDFSVLGRFISFPVADNQATGSIKINITQIRELGEEWDSDVLTLAYAALSTNTTNANVGSVSGNRMFFANDYMVHRGPGYVTSVRMYSTRTKNTECLNNQNPLGFHLSDGTVYTYMQGTEYEDIAAAWDWNLIPGITTDFGATPLTCGGAEHFGIHAFVGGASTGKVGAAAMQYTNPTTKALSWQKAWFFLDDDVQHVMIPSISHTSNASVYSVLDQKRLRGPVLINNSPMNELGNSVHPETLWHDNIGYAFSSTSQAALSVQTGTKTGDWGAIGISTQGNATVDLFAAWLNHGTDASFEPVSYTVFPAVDQHTFRRKSVETRLRDVRNDQIVSAVYDDKHHVLAAIFWDTAGGSVEFQSSLFGEPTQVTSSGNAVVMYRVDTGEVTASDPSQTLTSLQLAVNSGHFGSPTKHLTFNLLTGGLAGSSQTQKI
ncbi:polysaccharide lyase family 8 protein [Cristinia sonorae]|uniref:Polysaccharide lyase family 8 protein n=1 Tax=Cristinia sonorae TaxID=1940300 RepID=A0A8K0XRP1_9AGAR|nr:polysaccharide lyase family 8 protein [Cristinia sonorae]